MPIASIGDCSAEHWLDVRSILESSVVEAGFDCSMVSDSDDVGVIIDRIVRNVYDSDIIVCDVSHRNHNVMFELGLRLAFDKSVVIVKDDRTDYSFDAGVIEHLDYPRDLRFTKIEIFKRKLCDKIKSTHEASLEAGYSPFLKNFGRFNVSKIENRDVTANEYLIEAIERLRSDFSRMSNKMNNAMSFADEDCRSDFPSLYKDMTVGHLRSLVKVHLKDFMQKKLCFC